MLHLHENEDVELGCSFLFSFFFFFLIFDPLSNIEQECCKVASHANKNWNRDVVKWVSVFIIANDNQNISL